MRKKRLFWLGILIVLGIWGIWGAQTVWADPPATGPGSNWQVDAEVTAVAKSSERARQLLFWIMTHPPIYSVPVIASMWGTVLQIVLLLFAVAFVIMGFSYILGRGRIGASFSGISFPRVKSLIPKVVVLLAWALFSYIFVLGLVQIVDLVMGWFIGKVVGSNLFNIDFAGANSEDSYKTFIGLRDLTMVNQESAATSLILVRLTTFTYNFLTIMFVLRAVILWFLVIVSPILALLFPFIFIRNIGWIWIGEFFRWLFYGPLVAIFLLALVRIWEAGIPFGFDWVVGPPGRRGIAEEIVYPTAINILVGGPAQELSVTNSINYVDTYAEYVIALIMLWTVILLPFLLLRIFRDYCCNVFAAQQGILWAMYDKMKDLGKPSPPLAGPRPAAQPKSQSMQLPYREAKTRETVITKAQIRDMVKAETSEMVANLNLSMTSIRDIAAVDMNRQQQTVLRQNLNRIAKPEMAKTKQEQEGFVRLRQELDTRAEKGDIEARRVVQAASVTAKTETGEPIVRGVVIPRTRVAVAEKEKVEVGVRGVPTVGIPETEEAPQVAKPVTVSVEDYEEVKKMWVNHYRESEVPVSETVKGRLDWIESDVVRVQNALDLLGAADPKMKQKGMEEVANILPFILLGGFSEEEVLAYLGAKKAAGEQVREEAAREQTEKVEEESKEKVLVEAEKPKEEEKAAELSAAKEMKTGEEQQEES